MKIRNIQKFNDTYTMLSDLAKKHRWVQLASDVKVGRFSMEDSIGVVRLDIYTTKMTCCFMSKECKPKYFKRVTIDKIEKIMLSSLEIIWK